MAGSALSTRTAAQPSGWGKGREKILQEVLVHILQVSRMDMSAARLIGDANVPVTQPS